MNKNTFGLVTDETMHREEILSAGHLACAGCGIMPMMRLLLKTFGRRIVVVTPACCYAVIDGPFPYSATGVPLMQCAFETAAASASGVRAALDARGIRDVHVIVLAGDGGTFDIGFQALSAAAERNENFIYVCYDNEGYMNTGIQRSSATPLGAWTTTTPERAPKAEPKKNMGAIMAAHRIPYFATASLAFPEDLIAKFEKARNTHGFRMIHYNCPCPTGWKADSRDMVLLARLAVQSRFFPLYEVLDGEEWRITVDPDPVAVHEYFKIQGRFKHIQPALLASIQKQIDGDWARLQSKTV
ncbi:MAG: pyruvate synthase subunit beta [Acidobacteria bacterium]|nr:pyruvate synthase subunit beta [Acidobacteriota bacterium]